MQSIIEQQSIYVKFVHLSKGKMKNSIFFMALFVVACNNVGQKKSKPEISFETKKVYENKSTYSVQIGDTIEIYHTTNSCCLYCQPNAEKLNHLKYIGSKIVINEKKDCAGCNHTAATMFVAKSSGVDTIIDALIRPLTECNDSVESERKFIVKIM